MQIGQPYQIRMLGDRADRGLMYGEACFETLRVIRGANFRWPAHLARLRAGAAAFGWVGPEDAPLRTACLAAAERVGEDVLVRLTLSGGQAPWGLWQASVPEVQVQAIAYAGTPDDLRLQALDWPFPPRQRPAKFSADYAETLRAMVQWRQDGWLDPAAQPLVCAGGRILAGLSANVLLHRHGRWLTPEIAPGVLPGIVRQALVEAGVVTACPCPVTWLGEAEAMAQINAGAFVRPVAAIDGRALDTAPARFAGLWRALEDAGVPA
jgi:branched-subunit amino acid aminotransferase/4-amino-4-deoxychorismate lyase